MANQVVKHVLIAFIALFMMISNRAPENKFYTIYRDISSTGQVSYERLSNDTEDCNKAITHLALSPDSTMLAMFDDLTASIELRSTNTYSLVETIPIVGEHVTDITFSADNQLLGWASSIGGYVPYGKGSIELYDLQTNTIKATLNDVADVVTELSILDDGETVSFIGARYGYLRANVQIWDAVSKTNIVKRDGWDIAPAFSPSSLTSFLGTKVSLGITNEFEYQIQEWDGQQDIVLREVAVDYPIAALALNHDGSVLASTDDNGIISFWDTSTLSLSLSFQSGDSYVAYMAFIGDDQLLTVGQDGDQENIRIWNIDSQPEVIAQRDFEARVIGRFDVEPNEHVVLFAQGTDETFGLSLWNYATDTLQVVELDC